MGDIETMARTIWGESRSEGEPGMEGVGNVIMNRYCKHSPRFGLTITEVCLKPYQFSCQNYNDPNRAKLLAVTVADPQYAQALAIANRAVAGLLDDNTNGALFYFVTGSPMPSWAEGHTACAVIGKHSFFNDIP